ncbi:MAG: hypothetical protein LBN00_03800 [Oscillospiraceae bacterium]|jgi:hypothetical protein|nr:hypothetical protein [Oscillospiraceae bacterium]
MSTCGKCSRVAWHKQSSIGICLLPETKRSRACNKTDEACDSFLQIRWTAGVPQPKGKIMEENKQIPRLEFHGTKEQWTCDKKESYCGIRKMLGIDPQNCRDIQCVDCHYDHIVFVEEQPPRWRAVNGESYYCFKKEMQEICWQIEWGDPWNDKHYNSGNYHKTLADAARAYLEGLNKENDNG